MARRIQTSNVHNTNHKEFCIALCLAISAAFICHQISGAQAQAGSQLELKLVQVVFRHGNRTPESPYWNDPNENETFFPYGWDQLDAAGRARAYDLGRFLKDLYGKFIGDEYIPGVVNITATDRHRTKMCAQLVAAGLFPPPDIQKWGSKGSVGQVWQPITFNYLPQDQDDIILGNEVPCPAYFEEFDKFNKGPVHAAWLDSDPELVDAVVTNAHVRRSVHYIESFHQTLRIEDFNNLTIPDWVKPFYPDRFMPFGVMHFKGVVYNRKMQRLAGGPLLGQILSTMESHRDISTPLKMWLYSAHDDTVTRLGYTMRVWRDFYPDFSCAIIVELLSNSKGDYFVKTFFHNDTSKLPIALNVEGCDHICPLEQFRSILDDSIPKDRKKECYERSSASIAHQSYILVFLLTAGFFLF